MQPVSRVDQVLLLLRKQLAERVRKGAASGRESAPAARGQVIEEPLAELLSRRVSDLRAAGLSDRRTLTRVLMEQVLLAEFGRDLMNDANFQRIVDDVQEGLEDDPELDALLSELIS